jgi:hypothetical protein
MRCPNLRSCEIFRAVWEPYEASNMYTFPVAVGLVPPGVVTVTFTVCADETAGALTVSLVPDTTVTEVPAVVPNFGSPRVIWGEVTVGFHVGV